MPYHTKQQQALLQCLADRRESAVTVGELSQALREAGCPVGLATIYRQLERLEGSGHIHKVSTEEGALYQYCDRDQPNRDCFLLQCEGCGRIFHLDCSHLAPLYDHLEQEHHFAINPRRTMFVGLCADCTARKKEES